jgi:DNA-binding transcriptional MocR family regulator
MNGKAALSKVTFDGEPPAGVINLGIGQPSADLLPVDLLRAASEDFLKVAQPKELNYGERQGDVRFRESLADFLSLKYEADVRPGSLMLTCGNSQALEFICERFTHPGDTVFVEEPAYFLAFQIFRDHGLNIVPIKMDQDGLIIEALEQALQSSKPTLLYTIPSFSNPGGQTLSASRRERLVDLSREHDFIIAADEVYQMLPYFGEVPPALGTMIDRGNVISMGTFSKIIAPGLRLGWIQAPKHLMDVALDSGWINSGGAVNHVMSHIVRHAIDMGLQESFIEQLCQSYQGRVTAMDESLKQNLSKFVRWTRPDGGYFFWLELSENIDATALRAHAFDHGVGFQPGEVFSSTGRFKNFIRLSFAHYSETDIREGISRLSSLLNSFQPA